jgi:phosphatidate cytidylyltransferase
MPPTHSAGPTGAEQPASGRAGRDLRAAIGVGLVLGGLVVATLFTYRAGFVIVVGVTIAIGIWETARSVAQVDAHPPRVPLVLGGVAMIAVTWFRGSEALVIAFFVICLICLVWRLGDGPTRFLHDVSTAALITFYVPFLAGFAVLLAAPTDGARRVIVFMATVACSDVGGYASGVFLGRHPMAPTVSPAKSWEGFAGSALLCVIAGSVFLTQLFDKSWWTGVLYGLAIAATATLGDLGESMLKRDLQIKDMGTILPGHGGVMDRLDSLLPAAAVSYLLLAVFVPIPLH